MVRINLLGDTTVIDHSGKLWLVGYVAALVALLVSFVVMQRSLSSEIEDAQAEVQTLETRLAQLKKTTEEVNLLEKKKNELALITATMARLKLNQQGPVKVMDDINLAVPGKAWLTQIDEKEGTMKLTGIALSDQDVVQFLKNLESSDYFSAIDLVESVSVSMIKITSYNHFTGTFTRYTVRAEDRQTQMGKISEATRKAGLQFISMDAAPAVGFGASAGGPSIMSTGSLNTTKIFRRGMFRRGSSREEKVSAWASVEPVQAKAFTVNVRVLYGGRLKDLLARAEVEAEAQKVTVESKGGGSK